MKRVGKGNTYGQTDRKTERRFESFEMWRGSYEREGERVCVCDIHTHVHILSFFSLSFFSLSFTPSL